MRTTIAYFLGTHEDWGGASRALLNFVRRIDAARFRPIVVVTRRGNLASELERRQIECVVWPVHDRGPNLLRYAAEIWTAARFLRQHLIQVVHINYGAIGYKPPEVLAARLMRIPIVQHLHVPHGDLPRGDPSSFIRYSSAVVAVSQYVADHSESMGVPKHVIHNITDLQRFSGGVDLRGELGYSSSEVIVAFLGQLIRAKGLEMFVEVASRIADQRARFVVAGRVRQTEGAYTRAEIEELVARDSRIRYIGHRDDVENLYATADIIVMPSQWDEPFGLVLLEAAAAGKPVVATATGGIPEIVRDGETGFLVDRTDVAAMTSYIRKLIENADLRRRLGEAAASLVRQSLAVDPVRRLEELYLDLAGR